MPSAFSPAALRISGLAPHVLVMYTTGCQSALAALALASSLRNVMHWTPRGTATITPGASSAMLDSWACGGASSPTSDRLLADDLQTRPRRRPSWKLSMETLPNSLLT